MLPLVNECVACLREGVVADADLIDAGVIFGTGFAPFRGGPLHYAQEPRRRCHACERLAAARAALTARVFGQMPAGNELNGAATCVNGPGAPLTVMC